ncbi:MAG: hypothetical protein HYY24_12485 [Verrucomicrobia bacterium]|nr:hypothetical protein [Verrucomicrobiota bacterium]
MSENNGVQVRFLLGPAGSGKTYRCLSEIRASLAASPEGPPLLFLAPKQATFQLERQLLVDDALAGYTRLRILSFERLAEFVFERLGQPTPALLSENDGLSFFARQPGGLLVKRPRHGVWRSRHPRQVD